MNNPGTTVAYLLPGMQAKFYAKDHFVRFGTVSHKKDSGDVVSLTTKNGFVVDDESTGTIQEVPGEPSVIYSHKKFSQNVITFYARTGEIGKIYILSVPIHDHSSIVTGGPAYGTYFTDDEEVSNNT